MDKSFTTERRLVPVRQEVYSDEYRSDRAIRIMFQKIENQLDWRLLATGS